MVVDIVNYFARQVEGRGRASSSAFTLLTLEHRKSEARNQEKTENSRRGGQHSPYAKVHDEAERLWREDRKRSKKLRIYRYKKDVARIVVEKANAAPEDYNLPARAEVDLDTIYDELCRRTKNS